MISRYDQGMNTHPETLTPNHPAVEVEMPGERPAHLTDVTDGNGDTCAHMFLDPHGNWYGVDHNGTPRAWLPAWIASATHPEHGPIHRDGDHPDGMPRFVKEARP